MNITTVITTFISQLVFGLVATGTIINPTPTLSFQSNTPLTESPTKPLHVVDLWLSNSEAVSVSQSTGKAASHGTLATNRTQSSKLIYTTNVGDTINKMSLPASSLAYMPIRQSTLQLNPGKSADTVESSLNTSPVMTLKRSLNNQILTQILSTKTSSGEVQLSTSVAQGSSQLLLTRHRSSIMRNQRNISSSPVLFSMEEAYSTLSSSNNVPSSTTSSLNDVDVQSLDLSVVDITSYSALLVPESSVETFQVSSSSLHQDSLSTGPNMGLSVTRSLGHSRVIQTTPFLTDVIHSEESTPRYTLFSSSIIPTTVSPTMTLASSASFIHPNCQTYRILNGNDRSYGFPYPGNGQRKCDNILNSRAYWYRYIGHAGTRIATSCPATYSCSTLAPGWMTGSHPTVSQGEVPRTVCFHWNNNCCRFRKIIKVRNCGQFYVYKFMGVPFCPLRYCGNAGQGQWTNGCSSYSTFSNPILSMGYTRPPYTFCFDKFNFNKWYRITGGAGDAMATGCVKALSCGTVATGWLVGRHPTPQEGVVQRKVCFNWDHHCCRYSRFIKVRNCGDFYVYKFVYPPGCPVSYCGNAGGVTGHCSSNPCGPRNQCVEIANGYSCVCSGNSTRDRCTNRTTDVIRVTGNKASSLQGFIEVFHNFTWGTICYTKWSLRDANVACRMLGYTGAHFAVTDVGFGQARAKTWTGNMHCTGTETRLTACDHDTWGSTTCPANKPRAGAICFAPMANKGKNKASSSKSSSANSSPTLAVDDSYDTCYSSKEEIDPWLRVDLEKESYVYEIVVTSSQECCNERPSTLEILLHRNTTTSTFSTQCGIPITLGTRRAYKFYCRPPILGSFVHVRVQGNDERLVICHLQVYAFDSKQSAKGVRRELWFKFIETYGMPTMRENHVFSQTADSYHIIKTMDAPIDIADEYGQRLSAYFQPPENGNYLFYAACDDECEVWITEIREEGLDDIALQDDKNHIYVMRMTLWTFYQEWNKNPKRQTSKPIFLDKCRLYLMEVFMKDISGKDCVSIGMKTPSGKVEKPLAGQHLYQVLPGMRKLLFRPTSTSVATVIGSTVKIKALYKLCCHGVHCPGCALTLDFLVMGQRHVVNSSLTATCTGYEFTSNISVNVTPGKYDMTIEHGFHTANHSRKNQRTVGQITVQAITIMECMFTDGLCNGWSEQWNHGNGTWKFREKGTFAYIDELQTNSTLVTPRLPWKDFYTFTGLCLQFSYRLPNNFFNSILNVYLRAKTERILVLSLRGYHGNKWATSRVSWEQEGHFQVMFEGVSDVNGSISIAVDDITITSETCELVPVHAKPGFTCGNDKFKCKNGMCIRRTLRCDGNHDCIDRSDEEGCKCLANEFVCFSGKCVASKFLCDGIKQCKDGSDEAPCSKCAGYQCADGTCIPWTQTCRRERSYCQDDTHRPSVCGSCYLNNLGCRNNSLVSDGVVACASFKGRCTFDNGLCGMRHDTDGDFQWLVGQGDPATGNTRPSVDHTSYSQNGSYILIESSKRRHGDRARLYSEDMDGNVTVCLQFWYHMYGTHVGTINVYTRTNETDMVTWTQTGNHGNRWLFAQMTIRRSTPYKFVLEGVTKKGYGGDIAVDDFTVVDGSCKTITWQKSPSCYFNKDFCDWRPAKDWKLSQLSTSKIIVDNWRSPFGGFLYLLSNVKATLTITSPTLDSKEWRCISFWYYSGHQDLTVKRQLQLFGGPGSERRQHPLWSADDRKGTWHYVQIPLPRRERNFQVWFEGKRFHKRAVLAIDDVTFTKERCAKIPWIKEQDVKEKTICDGTEKTLICPRGRRLRFDMATYGRLDPTVCVASSTHDVTTCTGVDVLKPVRDLCSGQERCLLRPSASMFGNPCPNAREYLTVQYRCSREDFSCSFDYEMCDWVQSTDDEFDWTMTSASTPSFNTGPTGDHTSGTGQYLYIETSSPRRQGDRARLVFAPLTGTRCITFFYHMFGTSVGQLNLYVDNSKVFSVSGDQGNTWKRGMVLINGTRSQITIEGVVGRSSAGDIALDDISMTENCKDGYRHLGCYKDASRMSIPNIIGRYWDNYKDPVAECARAARMRAYKVFAVQWGGRCHSGSTAHHTYAIYGRSTACQNGRGNLGVNDVYAFEDANLEDETLSENDALSSCDSTGWCDWRNVLPGLHWKILTSKELYNMTNNVKHPKHSTDERVTFNTMTCGSSATMLRCNCFHETRAISTASTDLTNKHRQRCFSYNSSDVLEIADIPSLMETTLCVWVYTTCPGLTVQYLRPTPTELIYMGLSSTDENLLDATIMGETKSTNTSITDSRWHHLCLLASFKAGQWSFYKDGAKENSGYIKNPSTKTKAGGRVIVKYRPTPSNTSTTSITCIIGLNMWGKVLPKGEVVRMSYGCGSEAGDVISWRDVKNVSSGDQTNQINETCKQQGREHLLAVNTHASDSAVLESPWYDRSRDWFGGCLKFRYMLIGPGTQSLRVYQRLKNNDTDRILWVGRGDTQSSWRYGQTAIGVTEDYKILLQANVSGGPGYIAVAGMFTTADYCDYKPHHAAQACNQTLSKSSGYILSPNYPTYYTNNTYCVWQINAPPRHVIRLEFLAFEVEDHVTCAHDYLEIHDGRAKSSRSLIGRFCGHSYPLLVASTGNAMRISFVSNDVIVRTGFKAKYHFKADAVQGRSGCLQDCPSSCRCFMVPRENTIVVEGISLLNIPKNIPLRTKVLTLSRNKIYQLRNGDLWNLPTLEYIDIGNNAILQVEKESFRHLSLVKSFKLNNNFIKQLAPGTFDGVKNINVLDIGENFLTAINKDIFIVLNKLRVLSLRSNKIEVIKMGTFNDTTALEFLYLQRNIIRDLPEGIFLSLRKLRVLYLQNNKIKKISRDTFRGLGSLRILRLQGNKFTESDIPTDTFDDLVNLQHLTMDSFILCCYAKKSITTLKSCVSPGNEFSSCEDLMKNDGIRVCVWVLGLLAFLGNLLVIIWRTVIGEENRVQSVLLTNLAVADFLMGVYLLTVAVQDARWKGEYFKHDIQWRAGTLCQIAGALSILSSEVSVLMLAVITADRLICIVFPFKVQRLGRKKAITICLLIWLFGLTMSFVPFSGYAYFYDEVKGATFFGRSSVCLPMQLSSGRPAGWEYSVAVFIVMNFVAFLFILVAYLAIFYTVMKSSKGIRSTSQQRESALAKRLVFIILTDFCCWMPVIIIGILSLTGNFHDPQKQAYVWIAVLVLPINSSINPILYTFSTKQVKSWARRKSKKRKEALLRHRRLNDSSETPSTMLSTTRSQCTERSFTNKALEPDNAGTPKELIKNSDVEKSNCVSLKPTIQCTVDCDVDKVLEDCRQDQTFTSEATSQTWETRF